MTPFRHLAIFVRRLRTRLVRCILAQRVQVRHPTLKSDPSAIWDYGYADVDAIELGEHVVVGPYAEILVYRRTTHSPVEGRLRIGSHSVISSGVNIRAAGGAVAIGDGSAVGQHTVLVAANHAIDRGLPYLHGAWDETRTGIRIGDNVWIGAQCVVLPGVTIGDHAVVAAGSVVVRDVPSGELWGGVPARKIRSLPPVEAAVMRGGADSPAVTAPRE